MKREPSWAQIYIKRLNEYNKQQARYIAQQAAALEKDTPTPAQEVVAVTKYFYDKKCRQRAACANKQRLEQELAALNERTL